MQERERERGDWNLHERQGEHKRTRRWKQTGVLIIGFGIFWATIQELLQQSMNLYYLYYYHILLSCTIGHYDPCRVYSVVEGSCEIWH
jgi:hypothetical protein